MERSYYSKTIAAFIADTNSEILGELASNHSNSKLEELQKNAWVKQISILKDQLKGFEGKVYFEFSIPRMGKRVDNIVIINDCVFIIEFKVGDTKYQSHAIEQVIDYTLDLKNFHEGSHNEKLVPILVSTNADYVFYNKEEVLNHQTAAKANKQNLKKVLLDFLGENKIDIEAWENSIYKPTPTIVEAAQALYNKHNVKEITRSDAGAINLSITTDSINTIIHNAKLNKKKSICFITGVPGAGKTLAGLNIANERLNADEQEHAVFLSGNGPLVDVLREALARNEVINNPSIKKQQAKQKANAFIQNIHHFRDDNLKSEKAPIEKVVVFDEAQRAWNKHQTSSFMKRKKGKDDFDMSEPEFLIDVMNRHQDWCVIVCLIGGGQEINTGEAGLEEWINAVKNHNHKWDVHYSNLIVDNQDYIKDIDLKSYLQVDCFSNPNLHLAVSLRSFRSEKVSEFITTMLNLNLEEAISLYNQIRKDYTIVLTRKLQKAKEWLKTTAKGSERIGLIASSGARRLRPYGIDVKNNIEAPNWFLNDSQDVRSSYYLEDVATEFDIQGLEIDYTCVAWGSNFYLKQG
ncbi:MAG: DUF2075 domain-containing protein, partial [Oceanospirillaceae bacterium]|nr:DUF2075 domain-containing protein [Oceanospirillaceae bacterium]